MLLGLPENDSYVGTSDCLCSSSVTEHASEEAHGCGLWAVQLSKVVSYSRQSSTHTCQTRDHYAPAVLLLTCPAGSGTSKVVVQTCDAALLRGWRGVVYTRRGHGDSSLMSCKAKPAEVSGTEELPR